MNKVLAAGAATLVAMAGHAAEGAAPTPQPLVASCSADASARQLGAHDRTRFISQCVTEGRKREKQAEKACSEAAAYKATHERRKFMAECLKG